MADRPGTGSLRDLRPDDPTRVGPYQIEAKVGEGGMGAVYLGRGPGGHLVAVKVVRPELAEDRAFLSRFHDEMANAERVASFCTAQVLDHGEDLGMAYMVTEYIDGPSLLQHINANGPLTPGMLHGVSVGVAAALVAIHSAGLVHRDLKPSNVLLSISGPRVIDFGIARALDAATSHTKTGQVVGTPGYIAPEQILTQQVTPAVDVFAWGCLVAYAANGRNPFGTGSFQIMVGRALHAEPELGALTDPLASLVRAALDKEPERRPSARDLLLSLVGGSAGEAELTTHLGQSWTSPPAQEAPAGGSSPASGWPLPSAPEAGRAPSGPGDGAHTPDPGVAERPASTPGAAPREQGREQGVAHEQGAAPPPATEHERGAPAGEPEREPESEPARDRTPGAAGPVAAGAFPPGGGVPGPGSTPAGTPAPAGRPEPGGAQAYGAPPEAGRGAPTPGGAPPDQRGTPSEHRGTPEQRGTPPEQRGTPEQRGAGPEQRDAGPEQRDAAFAAGAGAGAAAGAGGAAPAPPDRGAPGQGMAGQGMAGQGMAMPPAGPPPGPPPAAGPPPFAGPPPPPWAGTPPEHETHPADETVTDPSFRPRGEPEAPTHPPLLIPPPRREEPRRRKGVVVGAAALTLVAVSAGGAVAWSQMSDDKPTKGATAAGAKGPAPFPTQSMYVRIDSKPGWPTRCYGDIGRYTPATKERVTLLSGATCDMLPERSPDGTKVAFTRRTESGSAVWIMDADGGDARKVGDVSGGRVTWSRDGTKLAVLRKDENGTPQVYTMGLNGESPEKATDDPAAKDDPMWSPTADTLVFWSQRGGDQAIYTCDLSNPTAGWKRITPKGIVANDPEWSPDGKQIAYTRGKYPKGHIWVVNADGTGHRQVTTGSEHEMDPNWSPDGQWLAYVRGPYSKPSLRAIRVNGNDDRSVSDGTDIAHPNW